MNSDAEIPLDLIRDLFLMMAAFLTFVVAIAVGVMALVAAIIGSPLALVFTAGATTLSIIAGFLELIRRVVIKFPGEYLDSYTERTDDTTTDDA